MDKDPEFDPEEVLNFTTVKDLADELNMDKSNLRKYILGLGIEPLKIRDGGSGQQILALTEDNAQYIKDTRRRQGFTSGNTIVPKEYNGNGVFYVVQIIPEFEPNRVKLGFASNAQARLQAHKTSAPTAQLVQTWDCKRSWEDIAIVSATRTGCKLIANEVFLCDDLDELCDRIGIFFAQLPDLDFKIE